MSAYVNKDGSFTQTEPLSRECPHCGATAQLLPVSTPSYDALIAARPRQVGIAYRCASCNEPRFLRTAVRAFTAERIELAPSFVEVERAKERFAFSYLPKGVETLFREALDCYTADCLNAFASMCRRTIVAAGVAGGGEARARLRARCRDVAEIGELEPATQRKLEAILFDGEEPPAIDAEEAAVLIEVMKDMLQQQYVRVEKVRAALRMRRFLAGESRKVAQLDQRSRESA